MIKLRLSPGLMMTDLMSFSTSSLHPCIFIIIWHFTNAVSFNVNFSISVQHSGVYYIVLEILHHVPLISSPLSHPNTHLPLRLIPKEELLTFPFLLLDLTNFRCSLQLCSSALDKPLGSCTSASMCLKSN